MAHPDQTKPYKLYTDASQFAIGAVLTQEINNEERVIQFLSKQLNKSQKKWATNEKETYAIVYAVNKLRHYLYGSKFLIMTDHKPLRSLFTAEMKNARIQRWAIMLSEFGCGVEYLAGKDNIPADALSRVNESETDIAVVDASANDDLVLPETTPPGDGVEHATNSHPRNGAVHPIDGCPQNGAVHPIDGCPQNGAVHPIDGCPQNGAVHAIDGCPQNGAVHPIDGCPQNGAVHPNDGCPRNGAVHQIDDCPQNGVEHPIDENPQEAEMESEGCLELENFQMHVEQHKDAELEGLITLLLNGAESTNFVLDDDLLYHIAPSVRGENAPILQLAIPAHLTRYVLEQLHCSPFGGGHMSAQRTYDQIRRRYFWHGMYRDVHKYVSQCDLCNQRKKRLNRVPIQSMPIAQFPFQIIGIDLCGPFNESNQGNKYILTIIDHLSGWPEAFALKNKTAQSVAEIILTEIIPRHACPQTLISDRGTEFVNAIIDYITQKLKIAHIKTSPYHPQSNGKTERFHRYLNDSLAKYSIREPNDWDKYIPSMLMAYRTITNETTEKSPFLLMYGRDPVLPIDTLLQPQLRYMGDDYVPTMLQRLHIAYNDARNNIRHSKYKNQELANRKAKLEKFEAGDAVYYLDLSYTKNEAHCSKLQSKWKPFYRIVKRTSPVNYQIRHQTTGVTKNVHVKDLKAADPSNCWDRQYEKYTELTNHVQNPTEPVRRRLLLRLAKLTAPLADPAPAQQDNQTRAEFTQNNENKTVPALKLHRTDDGWRLSDTTRKRKCDPEFDDDVNIPPVRLRKTSQGWAINTDDNEMDIDCITLYDVQSDIIF